MKKLLPLAIILYLLSFNSANAAAPLLKIVPPGTAIEASKIFSIRLELNTDVPVNAYSIVFTYSDNLEVTSINTANSIIDIWRNQPAASTDGIIKIEGGSTHAFSGEGGEILTINFKAPKTGEASLGFRTAAIYAADGYGTLITSEAQRATFTIQENSGDGVSKEPQDIQAPTVSSASFLKDPYDAENKILSFNAQDKGSGVSEVLLRIKTGMFWSDWTRVVNPVGVPDKVWAAEIKVIDNSGNIGTEVLYDFGALWKLIVWDFLVIVSGIFLWVILRKTLPKLFNKVL